MRFLILYTHKNSSHFIDKMATVFLFMREFNEKGLGVSVFVHPQQSLYVFNTIFFLFIIYVCGSSVTWMCLLMHMRSVTLQPVSVQFVFFVQRDTEQNRIKHALNNLTEVIFFFFFSLINLPIKCTNRIPRVRFIPKKSLNMKHDYLSTVTDNLDVTSPI